MFPEGCAYRRCAVAALKEQKRPWHLSFVSPSFECLRAAAVEGMGITVLARALVAPPLRIVRHGIAAAAIADGRTRLCARRAQQIAGRHRACELSGGVPDQRGRGTCAGDAFLMNAEGLRATRL